MNSSNPDGANSKCYSIEIMSKLERTIFNLTQDNLENAIDIVIELFDINFPYTYNLFISNLIYFAFYSKIEVSDLYLSYLERIQKKEEEIDSKNLNIIKIFCEYISRINSQESNYLIEQMIERNLINASFTKNISTPYFYHYKTENEIFAKSAHIMSQNLNFFKNYKVLSKNDFELHKKYIKEGHNPNEIAKIIRNDEIEKLQEVSSQENFDFNQIFEPSIYERCSFVNDWGVSLIDYAAFFGSVQCFKYLLMNGAKGSNTGKYAVAGGNEEIIHLCEQNHSSFEGAYEAAIKFHRNDIFKYIYENNLETMYQYPPRFGDQYPLKFEDQYPQTPESSESLSSFSYLFRKMKQKDINDLGDICINNGNSEIFLYLLGKGLKIKESTINEAAKIGNLYLVKHFLLNNSIPNNILKFALKSGNIELVKYVLEQGVDLNTRNIWSFYLKFISII